MTGIETTVVTAIANGFIGQMAKSGWEGIIQNELLNKDVGQLVKEGKYLFLNEYTQRYWNRHGVIKVLKMSKPMNLESIYINVKCLEDLVRDYYEENLENKYRESNQRRFSFRDNDKQDGLVFANQEQYLMVFGEPGIGKSTFLRKVGLEALKGNLQPLTHDVDIKPLKGLSGIFNFFKQGSERRNDALIPVLLELKNFKENEINIQAFIENEFKICHFPNVKKNIRKKLEKGELLILLDGLDEVPSDNINEVVKKIQDFVDLYDKNRFIISCRTAFRKNFKRFTNIEIVEFDDHQIQSFINNWFSFELKENNRRGQNCWELLQKQEYKSAKELCQTPLLLTFLCVIYQKKQSFPTDRSILYQEALDILLADWAEHNELQENRSIDKKLNINLSVKIEKLLLSKIAYDNFLEDKLFFRKEDIVHQIEHNLQETFNFSQSPDGNKVLKTIEIEQGILVERARNKYSFSHLTFQEYLTAQYIYDNDLIEEVVKNHVTETRWKEVFLLVAGVMRGKADKLLLAMEKEAHDYLKTPLGQSKLVPILQWADEMTKDSPDSPIKPVGRRAIAYANANAYAYNIANTTFYGDANANANAYAYAYANANANANAYKIAIANTYPIANANSDAIGSTNAILIDQFVKLANLFSQDRIFSSVNIPQLIADLEDLKRVIPNDNANKKERREFVKQLFKIWNKTFVLTPELLNLSSKEIEEIDNHYFYINRLILDCKKVAVNISPTVWQEIEDRMLRVS
jgi:hypothetical protein